MTDSSEAGGLSTCATEIPATELQTWVPLCRAAEVTPDAPKRIECEGFPPLAAFNVSGEYFVTADTCSHGQASLSEGYLIDDEIECPWHAGRFCVRNGRATAFPAVNDIDAYETRIADGHLFVSRVPIATK